MVRYILAALALKAFSTNNATRTIYRRIGNTLGERRRTNANIDSYLRRGKLFLDLCTRYDAVIDGDKLLEIGTGWFHWYSIYLRLFCDVSITMFDILDNRQFGAMKTCFSKLKESIGTTAPNHNKLTEDIERIIAVNDFQELYSLFGLEYVIEKTGSLRKFQDNSFNCIFSFHVLEHVNRVEEMIGDMYRILKPGGYSIHQIGIDDHLSHYDKKESPKNYLRYSDTTWKLFFDNDVQYHNRIQMSDWLSLFKKQGFLRMEETHQSCNIDSLSINPKYLHYAKEDLACTNLTIVNKRPE